MKVSTNKVMSIFAFIMALPLTVIFVPFIIMAIGGKSTPSEPFADFYIRLLAFAGLSGICGLWLRVFIRPSEDKSPSASDLVTWLLLSGSASSLAVAVSIVYMEGIRSALEMPLVFVFIFMALIGLAMAVQNFLSNRSLRRESLKRVS